MADEGLPFPSLKALLGDNADSAAAIAVSETGPTLANSKKDKAHVRRPSNEKKKATPRKAQTVEVKDASAVKPKQTKSRNGCLTCKAKRLKCGEEKPGCQNCAKRNVACGGYKKVFQWRDYGQQNVNVKVNVERPQSMHATTNHSPVRIPSAASSQSHSPDCEVPPRLPGALAPSSVPEAIAEPRSKTIPAPGGSSGSPRPQARRTQSSSPSTKPLLSPHDSAFTTPPEDPRVSEQAPPPNEHLRSSAADEFASVSFSPQHMFAYRSRSLSPGLGVSTPTFTEFMLPQHRPEHGGNQDYVPFSMPEDIQVPLWSALLENNSVDEPDFFDEELDVLPLERHDEVMFSWPSHFNTPNRSKESSPSRAPLAVWNEIMPGIYSQPEFPINSPETLMVHFEQLTAGNLSIFDGPNENPWRTIVWPMALHSAALFHAVLAMTAFNLARDQPEFRIVGQEHKALSIQNINEGIRESTMTDHTAIATALALGFSEAWDQPTTTGNCHIKGAQALVTRALQQHKTQPLVGVELKRLKFLCNAWVYMDVIARLTSVDSDETTDFDHTYSFAPESPRMSSLARGVTVGPNGFGIDFGMPIDARLDPLMGCAGTLFPIIGRVANLVRKVCRSTRNSPGIVSQGRDLKRMLEDWDPPEEVESPEDPTTGVENARQTAEAYRWATLLHLHQAVPELPSLSSAELAQRAMAAVATVPLESRTTIVQIYPLMVAGCEQKEEEDRQWVRERWQAMMNRMRISVLDKCLEVAEEAWTRRDAYEAKPTAQRKLVRTSELKEVRKRTSPHANRGSDGSASKPGSVGMIFSYVETDSEPIAHQLKDVNGPDTIRRRKEAADRVTVDPAYSVRGPLHWVGVMWNWGWQVLLG